MKNPTFEHRHYVAMAKIIAALPADLREPVVDHFTRELRVTNPRFSAERFEAAASGTPCNGRDR